MHHLNIGVRLRYVTKLGLVTLDLGDWDVAQECGEIV